MPYGHPGTPCTQPRGQASAWCRERRGRRPGRRPGGRGQGPPSTDVPLTGGARPLCARRVMIPRAHAGPRGEGPSGRAGRPVGADFRHPRVRHACPNPREGGEQSDGVGPPRLGTRGPWSGTGGGRAGHRLVSWVGWASPCLEEDAWGWGPVAGQGRLEVSRLGPEVPLGQRRAWRSLRCPVGERLAPSATG